MYLGTSKITSKGQVTIPAEIRETMGLTPGTDVVFLELDDMVIIKKSEELLSAFKIFEKRARELKLSKKDITELVEKEKKKTMKRYKN
jgi:AbrB family looped-hinge helix DNA binding protein